MPANMKRREAVYLRRVLPVALHSSLGRRELCGSRMDQRLFLTLRLSSGSVTPRDISYGLYLAAVLISYSL